MVSHELPNDLKLKKLGDFRRVYKPYRTIAQRPAPRQFENLALKSKFPGKFQCSNAIDGSIEMLKNS